jgi:hypothetical protein
MFRNGWLHNALWIGGLCTSISGCAAALKVVSNCGNVRIVSNQLLAEEAEPYCRYAASEREKVETFWGATWREEIRIQVDSSYKISMALVPAYRGDRGFMEMPLGRVQNNDGALLHEIVHIYAPNDNRFLAEGLAVYLQVRIGGNGAFPNFGKDLDVLARQRLSEIGSLTNLNRVRTPKPLSTVVNEQTAYILAGSFVGFLITNYGLPDFRSLYETGNYDEVYGKSLETLEKEWRSKLPKK